MSRNAESSFFCKRCRADDAKRCRCPLPGVGTRHDWDADAGYNLWPDATQVPAAAAAGRAGSGISLRALSDTSRG